MSLSYDLTTIVDRDTSDDGWNVTQTLIFSTMAVGLGRITEDNAAVFYARRKLIEKLNPGGIEITPEQVRAHVGLKCNVIDETPTAWSKRIAGGFLVEQAYQFKKATK